jgi:hypothetical protein
MNALIDHLNRHMHLTKHFERISGKYFVQGTTPSVSRGCYGAGMLKWTIPVAHSEEESPTWL